MIETEKCRVENAVAEVQGGSGRMCGISPLTRHPAAYAACHQRFHAAHAAHAAYATYAPPATPLKLPQQNGVY